MLDQFAGWRVLRMLRVLSSGRLVDSHKFEPAAQVLQCSSAGAKRIVLHWMLQVQGMITHYEQI